MEDDYSPPPLSLRQKLKHSLCFSFTCCFRRRNHPLHHHHPLHPAPPPPPPPPSDANPSLLWLNPNHPSNFKEKCKTIVGNLVNPTNKHRRCSSTEFRYDPLSYSLNFEDGFGDEAPLRNFSARLPASPTEEKGKVGVVKEVGMREITAVGG